MIKTEKVAPGVIGMGVQVVSCKDIQAELKHVSSQIQELDEALAKCCADFGINPASQPRESEPFIIQSIRHIRAEFYKQHEEIQNQQYITVEDFENAIETIIKSIEEQLHQQHPCRGCH